MPITRYGDASHLVMVDVDGAVQVSNPRPLPSKDVSPEDCAADVAALDDLAKLDDVAEPDDVLAELDDVLAELDDAPTFIIDWLPVTLAAEEELDEPEPDTWDLVWATTFAPASMERSPGSFVP